jgi:hypothetical protein
MEINAGSLVIANAAGLLHTRRAEQVDGPGGADLGIPMRRAGSNWARYSSSGSLTASSFGLESGLVSGGIGRDSNTDQEHGGTVVLSGANDLRIDGG